MKQEDRFFHKLTESLGGYGKPRNDIDKIFLKSMFEIVNATRPGATLPKISVNLINNSNINAVAILKSGQYAIGIYYGLIDCISETVNSVIPNNDEYFSDPLDKLYISLLVLGFVVEHELVHISNGHVDYHSSVTNTSMFFEIKPSQAQLNSLDFQTFEMDADSCAMTRQILWAINIVDYVPDHKKIYGNLFVDRESAVRNCFFACSILFRIFAEHDSYKKDSPSDLSHPPSIVRQYYIFGVIETIFTHDERMTKEQVTNCLNDAFKDVEIRFAKYLSKGIRKDFLVLDKDIGEIHKYYKRIKSNWKNSLHRKLVSFAHCELPIP